MHLRKVRKVQPVNCELLHGKININDESGERMMTLRMILLLREGFFGGKEMAQECRDWVDGEQGMIINQIRRGHTNNE